MAATAAIITALAAVAATAGTAAAGGFSGAPSMGVAGSGLDIAQAAFSKELLKAARPARTTYYQQATEALSRGTSTARIPQTQYQIEGAGAGASTASQQTLAHLAAANLANTPQGIAGRGAVRTAGNVSVGSIPSDLLMQYILSAPSAISGKATGDILRSQSGLANLETEKYLQHQASLLDAFSGISTGVGSLAGHFAASTLRTPATAGSGQIGGGFNPANFSLAGGQTLGS